jgi:hypothetical protein
VIGDGEIQSHQAQHRSQQALRLAQPLAKYQARRQGGLDRQIGIARLAATASTLRRLPRRQRLRGDPKCQAAAPAKACLIFRPVRYLELHLADTMAAGSIVLERHGGDRQDISTTA